MNTPGKTLNWVLGTRFGTCIVAIITHTIAVSGSVAEGACREFED